MQTQVPNARRTPAIAAAALACAVLGPGQANAQDSWDFRGFIYLWGASVGGETTTGQSIDVSFSEVVEKLDFGIMGALEARRNRWAIFGDAIYLAVSDSDGALVGPGIPASADVDVDGLVLSASVGYDLFRDERSHLNGFGGLRYIDMSTKANLTVPNGSRRFSDTLSNLDGVVGVRGALELSNLWDLIYYADVGAGDSDLTWQAAAMFDYEINDRWTASFGYRHLAWEVDNSNTLSEISFSGPFVGAKFNF